MAQVELGGKARTLRYRMSSAAQFEAHMGGETLTQSLPKLSVKTLIWIGLRHEDDKLSYGKVERWIDEFVDADGDVMELWNAVNEQLALDGLFGKDAAEKARGKAQVPQIP
jgi:hypothetical protein